MGNSKQPESLTLIGPTGDVHNWPRFADYRISDGLLIPVGKPVCRYDATQIGTLAGELVATGYQFPGDPTVLLPFVTKYGLVTAHTPSREAVACDSLEAVSKIRRHVEITLGYLRDPKRSPLPADYALQHLNDGLRDWLSVGVSKRPGQKGGHEFGYQHTGLAGVIFEQLAESFAGARAFRVCKYVGCRKLFIVGPGGTAGRRSEAIYCSENCKVYQWRLDRERKPTPARAKRSKRPVVRRGGLRHSPR